MIRIHAHVDARQVTEVFRKARREINARTRQGMVKAGEETVLPRAKTLAGNLRVNRRSVAGSLIVRATARSAYLGSQLRGQNNRTVGLQNYGGTVTTPILPKRGKQAILVNGSPRARVTTPRHYTGRRFLNRAVEERIDEYGTALLPHTLRAFDGLPHTP